MPHRRRVQKGSFGSHLDELVSRFPDGETSNRPSTKRPAKLQERIDIHALLFARAWQVEDER